MAGQKKKATKKFEKNRLKDTIDRRKEFAKIKQRHQVKAKKRARNAGPENTNASEQDKVVRNGRTKKDEELGTMSTDQYFQSSLELPEDGLKGNRKRKRSAENDVNTEEDNLSETSSANGLGFEESDEEGENGTLENGTDAHKTDLDALAKNDPEFYKYLAENDAELLDFDENAELPGLDEMSEDERPSKTSKDKKEEIEDEDPDGTELSITTVEKWKTAMSEQNSLRAMRETVIAFKTAAYFNTQEATTSKYVIPDANVYHSTLVTALELVPKVLEHHLPPKIHASGKVRISTDSKKFRSLVPTLKSYGTSISYLLQSLSDPPTIKTTLNALQPVLPYLLSFSKLLRQILTTVITIWTSTTSTTDSATLITAFLILRRLFVLTESSFRTALLKLIYMHLVKISRITNQHTLPTINLLKNSAAELWSLDASIGYTTAFTHIRQLAVHLRGTITKPTKESHKQIYNWQYVHSLDFWARVVCHNCSLPQFSANISSAPLHPLIYPLVQLILGTIRLIPSPTYFPLHLHLIRSALRISLNTQTYIPLAPHLLSILASPEISKPPSNPSTISPLSFPNVLRAPKSYLRTRSYQDGICSQVQLLLAEFFTCWCTNIAFPELIVPPTIMLKRWLKSLTKTQSIPNGVATDGKGARSNGTKRHEKQNKNPKIQALFTSLLQKLSQQSILVESQREKVTFAPSDRAEVDAFMRDVEVAKTPLGAWVEGLRERERVEGEAASRAAAADA